jgi:hypothetical protein
VEPRCKQPPATLLPLPLLQQLLATWQHPTAPPPFTLREYCALALPSTQLRSGAAVPHADRAAFEAYARSRGYGRGGLYGVRELAALLAAWRAGAESSVEGSLYEALLEEVLWGVASAALYEVHQVSVYCSVQTLLLVLSSIVPSA